MSEQTSRLHSQSLQAREYQARMRVCKPDAATAPLRRLADQRLPATAAEKTIDAESIAPMPILERLIDDFFVNIHPLAQLPHRPTFRQSFVNRDDRTRPEFLALLASMICALVALSPLRTQARFEAEHSPCFSTWIIRKIDDCHKIVKQARGDKWKLKQPKAVIDAATSYLLGLSFEFSNQWNISHYYMAEAACLGLACSMNTCSSASPCTTLQSVLFRDESITQGLIPELWFGSDGEEADSLVRFAPQESTKKPAHDAFEPAESATDTPPAPDEVWRPDNLIRQLSIKSSTIRLYDDRVNLHSTGQQCIRTGKAHFEEGEGTRDTQRDLVQKILNTERETIACDFFKVVVSISRQNTRPDRRTVNIIRQVALFLLAQPPRCGELFNVWPEELLIQLSQALEELERADVANSISWNKFRDLCFQFTSRGEFSGTWRGHADRGQL
ncbi:hypothetical protein FDECE_7535 [Fusarium decemcellulare]|nr:hypothetical protein FDECE_7535 [Fusarium decemcellulare]